MTIKNTAVAFAVASALGASSAFALGPGTALDVQIVQMGSSAVAGVIEQVWNDYCAPNTLSEYRDNNAGANGYANGGTNYRAYICTLANNPGVSVTLPAALVGKKLGYFERETGGSVFGVNPVATATPESYMNVSKCTDVTNPPPAAPQPNDNYLCSNTGTGLTNAAPDIGISDVEPALFVPPNLPSTFPVPLSAAQVGLLTVNPLLQQVFGVGVGNGVKAKATNLSVQQLQGVLSGNVTDWHTVVPAIAQGTAITLCIRTAGSGTQASANAFYLNNPCSSGGQLPVPAASATVILNSSTGNLINCLDGHANSLGILSLADGPKATDNFAIISLDGTAATAGNAAQGLYGYAPEATLQYLTANSFNALQTTMVGLLANILSDPLSIAKVNAGLPAAAINALPTNGFAPSTPYAAANPVEWGSHFGNTCAPYILGFPQ